MSNNYSSTLQSNNTDLQAILNTINELPEASNGVELPTLTNEGSASDLLSGKQLIDSEGNIVEGTIATKTSSSLTASGATVTVPAGYYASNATKSVTTATRAETTISVTKDDTNDKLTLTASNNQGTGYVIGSNKTATKTVTLTTSGATATMSDGTNSVSKSIATGSAKTPATTVTKNPTISVSSSGLITASVSGAQSVTPTVTAGYVSSGTAGTITVSGSATKQLTTQAAKTITPSTSAQTAVASGRYTTGAVTVAAIPSAYVKPTATKSATTYTPTTSNQTIAAGTYCSGAQTIKGDANLKAENIVEGVSIFGVTGTHSGGSGGGSVETCTMTFSDEQKISHIVVSIVEDGRVTHKHIDLVGTYPSSYTVENVVCNRFVYIIPTYPIDIYAFTITGNGFDTCNEIYSFRDKYIFSTPTIAGSNVTIHRYDDD